MSKEIEDLLELKENHYRGYLSDDEYIEKINKILDDYVINYNKSADNSNPSEALAYIDAFIEENNNDIKNQNLTGFDIDTQAKWVKYLDNKSLMLSTIKQALIKAQEQEKFFDDNLVFKNGCVMSGFDYKGKQIVAMPVDEYDAFMKQEEALEIIKKKKVDMWHLSDLLDQTYEMYVAFCKSEKYEEDYILTEEEFNLLKEVLKNE